MMADALTSTRRSNGDASPNPEAVLNALAAPVLVIGEGNGILYVNAAAEQFLSASSAALRGVSVSKIFREDSPVLALLSAVRINGHPVTEYGVAVETPRINARRVTVEASPFVETPGAIVLSFRQDSIARKLDHQLTHRNSARSMTAMAAMLAHEVKNPLSGIRGAAQLLEQDSGPEERELTRLICDEADRIVSLVDRMEMFSDRGPMDTEPVNIHEVLDHVRKVAEAGFAKGISFKERYDPSLPPVAGNRDLLIQIFVNLIKNAGEAVSEDGGEIRLETRYQQGVRLKLPGGGETVDLPLVVSVIDNGAGIPEELREHLFEPFITSKPGGTGLGLPAVAKIVGDLGGVIEVESSPRRTEFRVALPTAEREESER